MKIAELFHKYTEEILKDPCVTGEYKEFIIKCKNENLDDETKEKIVKEIIDYQLVVHLMKFHEKIINDKDMRYLEGLEGMLDSLSK